jgi:hypothetical protein
MSSKRVLIVIVLMAIFSGSVAMAAPGQLPAAAALFSPIGALALRYAQALSGPPRDMV